jgi:S-(hydroxymethyl)mycothiol dehydrogenase
VMAGLGAAINTGAVNRDDTVAVIGCGGVGDAAIAGAALVGAKRIIAVDTDNAKLDWARKFGATHTVNARELDVVKTIQDLTDGFGANVVIDAVGRPETWEQAFYARDLAGTVVLVGVPTPDMRIDLVRRLPARTRLPHLDRPLPAGTVAAGEVRLRTHRPRRRRGGVPQNARR